MLALIKEIIYNSAELIPKHGIGIVSSPGLWFGVGSYGQW